MVSGSLAQLRLFGHLGAISLHSIMPTSTSGLAGEGKWVVGPGGFVARDAVTMGGNMDCFVFKEVCVYGRGRVEDMVPCTQLLWRAGNGEKRPELVLSASP